MASAEGWMIKTSCIVNVVNAVLRRVRSDILTRLCTDARMRAPVLAHTRTITLFAPQAPCLLTPPSEMWCRHAQPRQQRPSLSVCIAPSSRFPPPGGPSHILQHSRCPDTQHATHNLHCIADLHAHMHAVFIQEIPARVGTRVDAFTGAQKAHCTCMDLNVYAST